MNPSHGYLINSDSCVQYHLFLPWKGKRNPFPAHNISYTSEEQQDYNTFTHAKEDLALWIVSLHI